MRASHDRAKIAARATTRPTRPTATSIYTGPLTPVKAPVGAVRNRRAVRLTAIQRNSIGRRSEWNRPVTAPFGGWR